MKKINNEIVLFWILIMLFFSCHKKEQVIQLNPNNFETVVLGKKTALYTLKNADLSMAITNYGGRIVSLKVPDKKGDLADVVLGFNSIDEYIKANEAYHGALIGRVGNRISKGQFLIEDSLFSLPINNGENHLHGGPKGFHNQVWDVKVITENSITLTYTSLDGEMGYPGNLNVTVQYTLTDNNELKIAYHAITDKKTPINLTNHAFFNLGGEASGTINEHILTINAHQFTAVDEGLIPLSVKEVEGTPFDFRKGKAIGQDLSMQLRNAQLMNGMGYDHNFILDRENDKRLAFAASVVEPKSGRKMEVFTEEPGIQFYGGNFFKGEDIGKYGKAHAYRESFALETQHFPDSPNQEEYPSIILSPGETYETKSLYKFSIVE